MDFLSRFKRVTTSGSYMPEIDGLRFIAIIWVVIFHSPFCILDNPNIHLVDNINDYPIFRELFNYGFQGVELFFAISGFILGYPFAQYMLENGKKVRLKKYFLRRVTRLEPPYLAALVLYLVITMFTKKPDWDVIMPSFFASMFYMHFIIYGAYPFLAVIAWSLEIEVQFYILAPILTLVYKLKKHIRRILLLIVILGMPVLQWFMHFERITIYQFIQFFLVGILLADIYLDKKKIGINHTLGFISGIFLLFAILMLNFKNSMLEGMIYPLLIFTFYYLVFENKLWNKIFCNRILTTIGGMCYSIYLIHHPLLAFVRKISHYYQITDYAIPNYIINAIVFSIISISISAVFFLLIEKPCMNPNWVKNLRERFRKKDNVLNNA